MIEQNFLNWVAKTGAGIVAVIMIVVIVKDVIDISKGAKASSILKIIGEAIVLLLCIGLIFNAAKYLKFKDTAENVGSKVIEITGQAAEEAIGH